MLARLRAAPLLKDGAASFLIKLINLGLGLLLAVILARALGPEGYGSYSFALAAVTLLAIPTQVGLPTLLIREVAKYQLQEKWPLLKGLIIRSGQATLLFSAVAMLLGGSVVYALDTLGYTQFNTNIFLWAFLLMPLVALGNLRGATLRGLRKVLLGQIPEMAVRPGLLVLSVAVCWSMGSLSPVSAMELNVACSAVAFIVGLVLLSRALPQQVKIATPEYATRLWAKSVWPLSLLAGMHVLNGSTDVLLLGLLATEKDVGLYRIAVQGASLVSFGLYAVAMVVSPHFSRLYAARKNDELQKMVTNSTRLSVLLAAPVCLSFILGGKWILGFVFGQAYEASAMALAILCVGQMMNAMTGCVGTVLNMSGHERTTLKGVSIAAVSNVLLNAALIPNFGIEGAATATTISFALWNFLLWRSARDKLGIESSVFGWHNKDKREGS